MKAAPSADRATGRSALAALSAAALAALLAAPAAAEDRSITGSGNNLSPGGFNRGAANVPFTRISYPSDYPGDGSGASMLTDAQRVNARTISNTLGPQTGSIPNNRNLSAYVWMWGQFLTHDLDLASTSNGSAVNGSGPIAVSAGDPLGPNAIPFTRSNFVVGPGGPGAPPQVRQQVNGITSWIDASMVYGSDATRAAALRTNGGAGAKLVTTAGNLPGYNTFGLPNDNNGPTPANQLFLAGDVRANENVALTSMHTVFVREHNRLVDLITVQQPSLTNEQKYQLARKIVGAEMQAITYREYLPALLGAANAPTVAAYAYDPQINATITQSFAVAAFRFGHTTLSSAMPRVNNDGTSDPAGPLLLRNAFFNPDLLTGDPGMVEQLIRGGATQVAEEVDMKFVDDVRNFLFGPPGAGGLDLSTLNIQRGRDHGLVDYRQLRTSYNLPGFQSFNGIPTTAEMRTALSNLYAGNIGNIDGYVGGLVENHVSGGSLGPLFTTIIREQFERLRDGDRLFYTSNAAGLYSNGVLLPQIASIVDLNTIRFADILALNTGLNSLAVQGNVFFAWKIGDLNRDNVTDARDIDALFAATPGTPPSANLVFDANADGSVVPSPGAPASDADHLVRNLLRTEYGDANLDRAVNIADFSTLAVNFNQAGTWASGNFNGDGAVSIADFAMLAANFNTVIASDAAASTVPEPAAAAGAVLAVAGVAGRARRRRFA